MWLTLFHLTCCHCTIHHLATGRTVAVISGPFDYSLTIPVPRESLFPSPCLITTTKTYANPITAPIRPVAPSRPLPRSDS